MQFLVLYFFWQQQSCYWADPPENWWRASSGGVFYCTTICIVISRFFILIIPNCCQILVLLLANKLAIKIGFFENTQVGFSKKVFSFCFSKSTSKRGHFPPKTIKIGSRSSENEQIEVSKFGNRPICHGSDFSFFSKRCNSQVYFKVFFLGRLFLISGPIALKFCTK